MIRSLAFATFVAATLSLSAGTAFAQPVGTFRWQLQPYCNVLTLNVVLSGGIYTLDGFDDLCGATPRASASGVAFPNPDGTFGFGVTLVVEPGAAPLHIHATLNLTTISGTWRDSAGGSGALVFDPAIAPGSPRPSSQPAVFLAGISAGGTTIANVGSPVNAGDAANRSYVDSGDAADRAYTDTRLATVSNWLNVNANGTIRSSSASLQGSLVLRPAGSPVGTYCIRFPSGAPVNREVVIGSVQSGFNGGVLRHIVVTTTFGHNCNAVGSWSAAVETFNSGGTLADGPFMIMVAR